MVADVPPNHPVGVEVKSTAYCVAYIDKSTGTVLGASMFSEPNPTVMGNHHTFVLFEMSGDDYGDAQEKAFQHLQHKHYDWLGAVQGGVRAGRWRTK